MKQYRPLSYTNKLAITSFENKFCLKKRSRLIEAVDNRFYVKFIQLEKGLFLLYSERTRIIYRKLMMQLDMRSNVSPYHGIPLSVIEEKILIAKFIRT